MELMKLFSLEGKTALITGASRGLGLQMAEALGEMGCKVAITARKEDELEEAREHLTKAGIEVITVRNDLQQVEGIPDMVQGVLDRFGHIDILVNNAGATWGAPAEDHPDSAWQKLMTLNVTAPFMVAREVGKRSMIGRRQGKIVNIASTAGLKGYMPGSNTIAYATSKAAAINFTRGLACDWGRYNINVNAICPGFFPTKMTMGTLEKRGDKILERTPLQRLGGNDDLKGAIVYLSSEASRHVTGQALIVDGGYSVT